MKENKDSFYHDYACLNRILIEKYKIEGFKNEEICKCINCINEEPKYLSEGKIFKFIEEITEQTIDERLKNSE